MDNDFKWFAIMMIGVFAAMALMSFAGDGDGMDSEKTKQYKACIKYHTPKECEEAK